MYRSSAQLFPVKNYVPQSETLNSLSAYHSGHGGGAATCFISFPEYSVPAKAAEAITPIPNRHDTNFFIYFSFWLSFPFTLQAFRSVQVNNEIRSLARFRDPEPGLQGLQVFFNLY